MHGTIYVKIIAMPVFQLVKNLMSKNKIGEEFEIILKSFKLWCFFSPLLIHATLPLLIHATVLYV